MSIKVVLDSACDLPLEVVQQYGITVVPVYVNAGNQTYRDGIDLTRQEFYRRLPEYYPAASTATPGPEVFRQVYDRLADEGASEILSIHLSISLSSIVESAQRAAAETSKAAVTVLDSQQLSMGAGFLGLAAAQAASRGASMDEIVALLKDQINRTYVFAALDTLEFLKRSGRMNRAVSMLGDLLQIKPILRMYNGRPTSEKVRTRRKAAERLLDILKSLGPLEKVALLHSNAPERAEELLQQVADLLPVNQVFRAEISPTLGTHIGPGVVGFVCVARAA